MALLSVMIAIPLYTVALCLPGVHFLLQVADYMAASTEQVPQPRTEQVLVAAEARVEQVVPLLLAALPHALHDDGGGVW